mmetsp:Transcript_7075/g.21762  ORF Transcript_7075/g.21762 Transcript_7075/m.21762 type:complete len:260 (-) Transcript_7075:288-1067(-)
MSCRVRIACASSTASTAVISACMASSALRLRAEWCSLARSNVKSAAASVSNARSSLFIASRARADADLDATSDCKAAASLARRDMRARTTVKQADSIFWMACRTSFSSTSFRKESIFSGCGASEKCVASSQLRSDSLVPSVGVECIGLSGSSTFSSSPAESPSLRSMFAAPPMARTAEPQGEASSAVPATAAAMTAIPTRPNSPLRAHTSKPTAARAATAAAAAVTSADDEESDELVNTALMLLAPEDSSSVVEALLVD